MTTADRPEHDSTTSTADTLAMVARAIAAARLTPAAVLEIEHHELTPEGVTPSAVAPLAALMVDFELVDEGDRATAELVAWLRRCADEIARILPTS